ncbi:16S rRNA (guanine(966)-N(2))-methyltransferase RsmD [Arthrobacter sp. NIO-1057]|uniref:16S rRNA (guanine(966)-N(2))-methyltransferase RsmD n=1 Tax=Arthrobacter sp. NIO-1057 TaxID=993071 RepID=UPI00071D9F0A|nr:16S rRNA (guanine(966)-N(2))-methyltransferase RsmD [Arthrobacter sp. NIO-1057]KSU67727.1 16S rRNA (guanine(966)-N(2))-methyltransferase RsmD [Arthrobacter sp. NIO-1057]SCB77325.1 16S rRNA (guanine966-N2)-methyltransferase [Arthrobacter sp. NIO-1057]
MSRIIAGVAGGQPLKSVPGDATRPTTDRVKEALFSRLESWDLLAGARVLDLFAGSGALGIEAASRGARQVVLVEKAPKAASVCQQNAALVNKVLKSTVVSVQRGSVDSVLDSFVNTSTGLATRTFDVVLLDPPYPLTDAELEITLQKIAKVLAADATVIVERSSRSPEPSWPEELENFSDKKYGETHLWFAEPVEV